MRRLILWSLAFLAVLLGGHAVLALLPPGAGWPVLLAAVVLEVVVAPLPGGAVALLAVQQLGYWAWPVLYAGNLIGAGVVFVLARRFGASVLLRFVRPERLDRYRGWLSSHRWWFLLYAFPLFPIDVVTLAAGLVGVRAHRFFPVVALALVSYTALQTVVFVRLTAWWGLLEIAGALVAAVVVGVAFVLARGARR